MLHASCTRTSRQKTSSGKLYPKLLSTVSFALFFNESAAVLVRHSSAFGFGFGMSFIPTSTRSSFVVRRTGRIGKKNAKTGFLQPNQNQSQCNRGRFRLYGRACFREWPKASIKTCEQCGNSQHKHLKNYLERCCCLLIESVNYCCVVV